MTFPEQKRDSQPSAPTDDDARVRCDVDGPVATISLTRPDRRNAQTPRTWAALQAIGSELSGDVRVVVVRGEGTSFSAGLDRALFTAVGVPGVVDALLAPPRSAVIETKALLQGAALRLPADQLLAERQAQLRRIRDLAGVAE